MPLDAQGIWQYTGPELAAPAPTMLNRLAASTSTEIAKIRGDIARLQALTSLNAAVGAVTLGTTDKLILQIVLPGGTWDVLVTGQMDFSMTTQPRFFIRLQSPAATVDDHNVMLATGGGAVSVTLQKPGMIVPAGGGAVTVAGYYTGGGTGTAAIRNVKLNATRTA